MDDYRLYGIKGGETDMRVKRILILTLIMLSLVAEGCTKKPAQEVSFKYILSLMSLTPEQMIVVSDYLGYYYPSRALYDKISNEEDAIIAAEKAIMERWPGTTKPNQNIEVSFSKRDNLCLVSTEEHLVALDVRTGALLLCETYETLLPNSPNRFKFALELDFRIIPREVIEVVQGRLWRDGLNPLPPRKFYGPIQDEIEAKEAAYKAICDRARRPSDAGTIENVTVSWNDVANVWVGRNNLFFVVLDPMEGELLYNGD